MNEAMDVMSPHLRMSMRTRHWEHSAHYGEAIIPMKIIPEAFWELSASPSVPCVSSVSWNAHCHLSLSAKENAEGHGGELRAICSQGRPCPIAAKMECGSMGISIQVPRIQGLSREHELLLERFQTDKAGAGCMRTPSKWQGHEEKQGGLLDKAKVSWSWRKMGPCPWTSSGLLLCPTQKSQCSGQNISSSLKAIL